MIRKILLSLLILTAAGVLVLYLILLSIPEFLQKRVIPELSRQYGFPAVRCEVRSIGLSGADLSLVTIGSEDAFPLAIDSIRIDYSLTGLYHRRIDRVQISGIELHGEQTEGQIRLRGFDAVRWKQSLPPRKTSSPPSSRPFRIQSVSIRHSVLICRWGKNIFRIPFEIDLAADRYDEYRLNVAGRLFPRGNVINLNADVDTKQHELRFDLDAAAVQVDRFSDFTHQIPGLRLSGRVSIEGEIHIDADRFGISSADLSVEFRSQDSRYKDIRLGSAPGMNRQTVPLRLEISKTSDIGWKAALNAIAMDSVLRLTLSDMDMTSEFKSNAIESTGRFRLSLAPSLSSTRHRFELDEPIELDGRFSSQITKTGSWSFQLQCNPPVAADHRHHRIVTGTTVATFGNGTIKVHGEGNPSGGSLECSISIPAVTLKTPQAAVNIPAVNFNAAAAASPGEEGYQITMALTASGTRIIQDSSVLNLPDTAIEGTWALQNGGTLFTGSLKLRDGKFFDPRLQLEVRNIDATVPFQWPRQKTYQQGTLTVQSAYWQNRHIGSLKGIIQQQAADFIFRTLRVSHILPGVRITAHGRSNLFSSDPSTLQIHFGISKPSPEPIIKWGKLVPAAEGFRTQGKFKIDGVLKTGPQGIQSSLEVSVSDADIFNDALDLAVRGVELHFAMPQALAMRSAPAQKLSFKNATLNHLIVNSGKIEFQLENNRTLLIEKSRFEWCSGKVSTQAFRIVPNREDYDIVLHCDRLNLAMLLEQFGVGIAEGRGAVNGRIPLRFSKGSLSFDDAFLYSTPGDGGRIRVSDTEMLMAGVPADTPQYRQLDLVREALKDFDYEWAKIHLSSRNDNLLLNVQFDGRPAHPLPFAYRKDIGDFVRVEAGSSGSVFQGLRLDMNINLPLDKILQYKDIYRSLF